MRKLLILSLMMTLALSASAKTKFTLMDNAAIAPHTATVTDTQQRPQQRRRTGVQQTQRRRAVARTQRPAPQRYARRGPAPRNYGRPGPRHHQPGPRYYGRPGPRPYGRPAPRYHQPGPRPYGRPAPNNGPRRNYRR